MGNLLAKEEAIGVGPEVVASLIPASASSEMDKACTEESRSFVS